MMGHWVTMGHDGPISHDGSWVTKSDLLGGTPGPPPERTGVTPLLVL